MKRGIILLLLLLAACTPAAAPEQTASTVAPVPTKEPTALPTEPPPTSTAVPSPTPAPEPTATEVVDATFTTPVDLENELTLFSETPVIEREPGNKYLNGGAVIFHDGQFHMFSNFFNFWPGATVTYYYTSPDGRSWTRAQEEPLFTIDDVPLEGIGALVLSGLVLPDGTWALYYHAFTGSSSPGEIGIATASSPTGPWTFGETAVLSPGSDGEWDDLQVMRVNVLPNQDGYAMYYAGVNRQGESRIGLATSADGFSWEKYDDPTTTAPPLRRKRPRPGARGGVGTQLAGSPRGGAHSRRLGTAVRRRRQQPNRSGHQPGWSPIFALRQQSGFDAQ
ncbi:MAG: hypothetical protein KC445_19530 [Anaerolineales bacterium]|nr:hypothetical protein [Anaerolineales bacterium]